ncbi:MAG: chlorite dismutase family protein [Gemmatimonadaceae bacterium]|nr:chlorite dismutase family protein [Gemmatimonadaceae bacterium]MBA3645881.1 chlorite dismutase family protein [Gemmatimonadaceae bacterium]
MTTGKSAVHPPETLEGWYALHQIFRAGRAAGIPDEILSSVKSVPAKSGWTVAVKLVGSSSDVMVIHFREGLDAIGEAQSETLAHIGETARAEYSFLSVTEAGLYRLTAQLANEATARGGKAGDDIYLAALEEKSMAERESAHVRKRLYPEIPASKPYVCFYPMSKRRDAGQNWYTLSLDERSELMRAHGTTGRKYAGKVQQIISGAIGLDAWEWGVTLFAADPLDFKRLVTEMRFDEVSAKYAEFGDFYVGRVFGS